MAIAFNNASDLGNTTGTSFTVSYTVGSGSNRLLFVAVVGDVAAGNDDVTGVTYAGTSMTLLQKSGAGIIGQNRLYYTFFLLNPASGANNVVVSCTNSHFLAVGAADYTGVAQSGQPDASLEHDSGGIALTLTSSITTVADNCWVILGAFGYNGNNQPSAGAGVTSRATDAAFGIWLIGDSNGPVHPAGAYSVTTTYPGGAFAIVHLIGSFSPASAGPTGLGALLSDQQSFIAGTGGLVLA